MSEQAEMRGCPFCGGEAKMRHTVGYWVECLSDACGTTSGQHLTEAAAIAAWNKRATDFTPSEEEILAHQYEPSFLVKLPVEKRREILRRQAAEEVADIREQMAEATDDDIREAITSGYLEVETVSGQPLPEITYYCQGCQEKQADLAALENSLALACEREAALRADNSTLEVRLHQMMDISAERGRTIVAYERELVPLRKLREACQRYGQAMADDRAKDGYCNGGIDIQDAEDGLWQALAACDEASAPTGDEA